MCITPIRMNTTITATKPLEGGEGGEGEEEGGRDGVMNMHSQGLHHNFINSTWSTIIQYNLMQLPRMVSYIHHSLCVCVCVWGSVSIKACQLMYERFCSSNPARSSTNCGLYRSLVENRGGGGGGGGGGGVCVPAHVLCSVSLVGVKECDVDKSTYQHQPSQHCVCLPGEREREREREGKGARGERGGGERIGDEGRRKTGRERGDIFLLIETKCLSSLHATACTCIHVYMSVCV